MIGRRAAGVPPRVVAGLADDRLRARKVDQVNGVPELEGQSEGLPTGNVQVVARPGVAYPGVADRTDARPGVAHRTDARQVAARRDPGGSGSPNPASTALVGGVSLAVVLPRCAGRAPGGRPTVAPRPSGV